VALSTVKYHAEGRSAIVANTRDSQDLKLHGWIAAIAAEL
jgi:hypothetical protein